MFPVRGLEFQDQASGLRVPGSSVLAFWIPWKFYFLVVSRDLIRANIPI